MIFIIEGLILYYKIILTFLWSTKRARSLDERLKHGSIAQLEYVKNYIKQNKKYHEINSH